MTATPGIDLDTDPLAGTAPSLGPTASSGRARVDHGRETPKAHASPFARLGVWTATHFRRVLVGWLLVLVVFGFFAVRVEGDLAGAGWQASNSQSVASSGDHRAGLLRTGATALQVVVVDHHAPIASDPQAQAIVSKATRLLKSDHRVSTVVPPQAGDLAIAGRSHWRDHGGGCRQLERHGQSGRCPGGTAWRAWRGRASPSR